MSEATPVLSTLKRIVEAGDGSYALVVADEDKNYYAQLVPTEGGMYAELAGNAMLAPADQLSPTQQQTLRARGWESDGHENWSREWTNASTSATQQQILLDVLTALNEVYGAHGPIKVEEHLSGSALRRSLMRQQGSPVGVAVVVIGALVVLALVLALVLAA